MAYSVDFREAAIEYMDKGHTAGELYEAFGIYPSRIRIWRELRRKTGDLRPQYKETRESKIDMKKLAAALERKPDATLAELAKPFNVTEQAVHYALERLKITLKKKTFSYKELCPIQVISYLMAMMISIAIFRVRNFVFVDESGLNREQRRLYARAKRGVKIHDKKPGKRDKVNIVAGLLYGESGKKFIAVRNYEHSTTSVFFEDWFEWELLAAVSENSVIIMDNAPFHRKRKLREIAAKYGVIVIFLPSYCPQFNPIEQAWANFKKWIKYNFTRFSIIDFAIEYYFNDRPLLI